MFIRSNVYMSMSISKQNNSSLAASTGIFIWFLQVGRQSLRLSVDQAARLAGMETADWQYASDQAHG